MTHGARRPSPPEDTPIDLASFITAFATLFVIVDPIGLAPIFVALTQGMSPRERRRIGLRAVVISAIVLAVFALFGDGLLRAIGSSMPAFQIAGGVVLFLPSLDMFAADVPLAVRAMKAGAVDFLARDGLDRCGAFGLDALDARTGDLDPLHPGRIGLRPSLLGEQAVPLAKRVIHGQEVALFWKTSCAGAPRRAVSRCV